MQNGQSQLLALLALAAAANGGNGLPGFFQGLPEEPREPEVSTDEQIVGLLEQVQDLALTHKKEVLSVEERNYLRNVVSDAPNAIGNDNKYATDTIILQLKRCVEILESTPKRVVPEDIKPEELTAGLDKLKDMVELLDAHVIDESYQSTMFEIKQTLKHARHCIGTSGINQQRLGEVIQEAWNKSIKVASFTASITVEDMEGVMLSRKKSVTGIIGGEPYEISDRPVRADMQISLGEPVKNENKAIRKSLDNSMTGLELMSKIFKGTITPEELQKLVSQDVETPTITECKCRGCQAARARVEAGKAPALDAVTQFRGPWATSTSAAPALDAVPQVRETVRDPVELLNSARRELIKETLNRNVGYVETELSAKEWYDLCKPKMHQGEFFSNNVRDANHALGAMMATFNPEHFTLKHRKTFRKLLGFAVSMHDADVPVTISVEKFENVEYRGIVLKGMYLVVKTGSGKDVQTYYHGISFAQ